MKRSEMIDGLLKEGFSEGTLVKFNDKQLSDLHERIFSEQMKKGGVIMPKTTPPTEIKKVTDQGINVELREKKGKPSAGLSKEKKSEIVKKAKKGKDIGKKGKGFAKIEKKAKESGAKDPKAVAAAAMWKNIKRESTEVKEWVNNLFESNYHPFTSKGEIMELIKTKMVQHEEGPKVKKGHNGVPEFMTYDAIKKSEVSEDKPATAPVKPKTKPDTKPKPSTPYQPGPGKNPKPKALKETKK